MDITTFNEQYTPILRLIVVFFGFLLVIIQIRLATKSLKGTLAWNKVNAAYNMLDFKENTNILLRLIHITNEKGFAINFKKELTDEEVEKIISDFEASSFAKQYLNDMELYCVAIHSGIVDKDLAYDLYHARFIQQYKVFKPFIHKLRDGYDDGEDILIEFEKTALAWINCKNNEKNEKDQKKLSGLFKIGATEKQHI